MAPAITLNRMYHCVPSSMSTMLPEPRPTPAAWSRAITSGKSIGAGKEATTWTTGWSSRDSRGDRPMASPAGSAQSVPSAVDDEHPRRGSGRAAEAASPSARAEAARGAGRGAPSPRRAARRAGRGPPAATIAERRRGASAARDGVRGARGAPARATPGGARLRRQWREPARRAASGAARSRNQLRDASAAARLLDAELLRPDDHRPPEELVERHDHQRHREHGRDHRSGVALRATATLM